MDPNLACNTPGTTVNPQLTATIPAGSEVTAYWNNPWPHAIGPMMVYMAVSLFLLECTTVKDSLRIHFHVFGIYAELRWRLYCC